MKVIESFLILQLDVLFGNLTEMVEFQVEFLKTLEDGVRLVPDLEKLEKVDQFKVSQPSKGAEPPRHPGRSSRRSRSVPGGGVLSGQFRCPGCCVLIGLPLKARSEGGLGELAALTGTRASAIAPPAFALEAVPTSTFCPVHVGPSCLLFERRPQFPREH